MFFFGGNPVGDCPPSSTERGRAASFVGASLLAMLLTCLDRQQAGSYALGALLARKSLR